MPLPRDAPDNGNSVRRPTPMALATAGWRQRRRERPQRARPEPFARAHLLLEVGLELADFLREQVHLLHRLVRLLLLLTTVRRGRGASSAKAQWRLTHTMPQAC
eukprot:2267827-Pleurochrysis_carterae.AAC.2